MYKVFFSQQGYHLQINVEGICSCEGQMSIWSSYLPPRICKDYLFWLENIRKICQLLYIAPKPVTIFYQYQLDCWWSLQGFCTPFRWLARQSHTQAPGCYQKWLGLEKDMYERKRGATCQCTCALVFQRPARKGGAKCAWVTSLTPSPFPKPDPAPSTELVEEIKQFGFLFSQSVWQKTFWMTRIQEVLW